MGDAVSIEAPEKTCLKKGVKRNWLGALRNPKVRKARGKLKNLNGGMCCLGVLAKSQHNLQEDGCTLSKGGFPNYTFLTDNLLAKYGLSPQDQLNLVKVNDNTAGFNSVIEIIEALPSEDDQ